MAAQLWEVVGGGDKGGLLVRGGQDLASPQLKERLATGSLIVEEELVGARLRFRLLAGHGPSCGWVSTALNGRSLLERAGLGSAEGLAQAADEVAAAAGQAPDEGASSSSPRAVGSSCPAPGGPCAAAAKGSGEEEDEAICRICFGDREDGELVAPCACSGDQRFVHTDCLLRWQRMALVNQPTHPSTYEKHTLHRRCGICQQEFTTRPPTRHELMESFTGAELAAMISEGCLLATDEVVSQQLERQQEEHLGGPERAARCASSARPFDLWIRSAYLIAAVHQDDGLERLPFPTAAAKEDFKRRLAGRSSVTLKGRQLRIVGWEEAQVCLAPLDGVHTNCGNDHVVAVNLVRPLAKPPSALPLQRALARLRTHRPGAAAVEVSHYLGGPCGDDSIMVCLVPGGRSGWTLVTSLEEALELAHKRSEIGNSFPEAGGIAGGQTVRVGACGSRPDLEGELGMALDFEEGRLGEGRWLVRLRNEEGVVRLPAADLQPLEGGKGRVFAFWGDARWSRVQLLGEIARGHWGLCRAGVQDVILPPCERWASLEGRLAFAPVTEMTERYLEEAKRQMTAYRAVGLAEQAADAG